jgi:hypothetical protein
LQRRQAYRRGTTARQYPRARGVHPDRMRPLAHPRRLCSVSAGDALERPLRLE